LIKIASIKNNLKPQKVKLNKWNIPLIKSLILVEVVKPGIIPNRYNRGKDAS